VRTAVAAGASLVALAAAPVAAARPLAPLAPRHQGPLVSLVTVSPPPSIAHVHPMRWTRWSRTTRALTATTLASYHGEALIGLRSLRDRAGIARDYSLARAQVVPGVRALDALVDDVSLRALLTRGHRDARIRYVEPNARVAPLHARNDPLTNQINSDIGAPYEWQFAQTRMDLALNLSHGSPSILIGDVDGGIADVPDLSGKIAERWFTAGLADANDNGGHGTAVASLLAANVEDGYGMAGFGGDSRVVMYRTQYDNASIASGITTLTGRGVRVINLSLGAYDQSLTITDAVQKAITAGVLVVAAVGNDARNTIAYPAQVLQPAGGGQSYGLAVGSDNYSGTLSYFSNFGQNLSLVAPGSFNNASACSGVFTAIPTPALDFDRSCFTLYQAADGARYVTAAGTSFSSPEVAGVAALIWAARPELANWQVASIIKDSASRPAGTGWTPLLGWGLLDAARALEQATGKSSADRIALAPTPVAAVDPGARLTATAKATWADDGVVVPALDVVCNAAAGGKALAVAAQGYAAGTASCSWDVPATAAGRMIAGSVGVVDPLGGATSSAPFRTAVVDKQAPTVQAAPSSGRWGQKVGLRVTADDGSGSVALHVAVFAGSTLASRMSTGLQPVSVHSVDWQAPRVRDGRTYHFCVTATDRAGNRSASSCAQIALG
jgi:subtilisin family serine protease